MPKMHTGARAGPTTESKKDVFCGLGAALLHRSATSATSAADFGDVDTLAGRARFGAA